MAGLSSAAVDRIVCSYLVEYSNECRPEQICEDWRKNISLSCSQPSCPDNSHYKECGSGCEKRCDDYECSETLSSGCYCNDNMVWYHRENVILTISSQVMIEGKCQPASECLTCEASGVIRKNSESWSLDSCTDCTCKGKSKQLNLILLNTFKYL